MWCSFRKPVWKPCSKSCDPTFTPRAPTTRQKPCRNVPPRPAWVFAWPLSATLRITRLDHSSTPSARQRMTEPCFLVVRLGSLGDIVHTFPAVAALRESFPRAEIVWLTHPRWRELVESSALVSEIWETETRSLASVRDILARIRKKKFTAAIVYQGLWKSAVLPFLGRVPRRLGFSWHAVREFGVPLLYTDRIRSTNIHIADQNGELLRRVLRHWPYASCLGVADAGTGPVRTLRPRAQLPLSTGRSFGKGTCLAQSQCRDRLQAWRFA